MVSGNGATRSCIYREGVVSGPQTTFQLAHVEWGSSLCWEGGEEGGRGGREGGEEDLHCVCVQTDRWCTVCTLIVKQHMSLCTYHDENVNLALEELDS